MKILLAFALVACTHPAAPLAPVAPNRADVLLTAEQPDSPHGPVGSQLAFMVLPDSKVLLACYSTDGKHTTCFDPVDEYVKRKAVEQQKQQEAQRAAQAKPAAEPAPVSTPAPKVEAPKKK